MAVISTAALTILIGRFIYVPFLGDWDVEYPNRIFGFKWLSIFLSRIGNEIAWLAMGLFLMHLSSMLPEGIKKHVKNLSALIIITAGYFVSWIFYQGSEFSRIVEISFSAVTAIASFYLFKNLLGATNKYIELLKLKIRNLLDIIICDAPEHINDLKVWDVEVVEPCLKMLNDE